MKGHDAGLKGNLIDGGKQLQHLQWIHLKAGDTYKIAGKEYTIGAEKADAEQIDYRCYCSCSSEIILMETVSIDKEQIDVI